MPENFPAALEVAVDIQARAGRIVDAIRTLIANKVHAGIIDVTIPAADKLTIQNNLKTECDALKALLDIVKQNVK